MTKIISLNIVAFLLTPASYGSVDIIVGLFCIIIGVIIGVYNYKNSNKFMDSYNLKGWIGSIGFIILGIMCLIGKGGDLITNIKALVA